MIPCNFIISNHMLGMLTIQVWLKASTGKLEPLKAPRIVL